MSGSQPISVFKAVYTEDDIEAVRSAMLSGWTGFGPKSIEFDLALRGYFKVSEAICISSGTQALILALESAFPRGGMVLVPSLTYIATVEAICRAGCHPVFVDVDEETLTIDPDDVRRKWTSTVKGVVGVDYAGCPCNWQAIRAMVPPGGVLISDSAHAAGSRIGDKPVAHFVDYTCFSFQAVKNLSTGEGGAVLTHGSHDGNTIRCQRFHGLDYRPGLQPWDRDARAIGWKGNMGDANAALGLSQLQRLEANNDRRRAIAYLYDQGLSGLNWVQTPKVRDGCTTSGHMYVIRVPAAVRDALQGHLASSGIATSIHYKPVHTLSVYGQIPAKVPVTNRVWPTLITLPVHLGLANDDVSRVIDAIRKFSPRGTAHNASIAE